MRSATREREPATIQLCLKLSHVNPMRALTTKQPGTSDLLSLDLEHTRCSRCKVWSRRPNRCPNCGAAKLEPARRV